MRCGFSPVLRTTLGGRQGPLLKVPILQMGLIEALSLDPQTKRLTMT